MDRFQKITDFLLCLRAQGTPSVDCAVMQDGKLIYRYMDGCSDTAGTVPLNGKERYSIYSCSKPITVTALLQLYEKGAFRLDEPVSRYLPEFAEMTVQTENGVKKAENPITIRNLFTMTAGLSYNLRSPMLEKAREETGGRCPTRETMQYLAQEPLLFEPGTCWKYSLCHDVLAALLEVLTGGKFADYVQKNIFDPLDMRDSTFRTAAHPEKLGLCAKYRFKDGVHQPIGPEIAYNLGTEYASGGAGCVSTVEDYLRFLEALRVGDVILKRQTVDLMTSAQVADCVIPLENFSYRPEYGYGLGVRCPQIGKSAQDFGWGGAAGAYLAVDRTRNYSLFYVQHVLSSPVQKLRSNVRRVLLECLDAE